MNNSCGSPDPSKARTFEEVALAQGILSAEQLEECRRVQQNVVAQGLECDLEEVLVKKGFVTKAQAMAIHAALGRGNRTAIEGYEIISRLGVGGQGAVYKAKQSSMDRFVALKVLLSKFAKDKDGIQRFLREAKVVARLNHPNIVSGIDAGYSNGIYYYVMEYVEGESLSRRLERDGKFPWLQAVSILKQMASALDHAHRNGLIHRDIKPANILLTKDGTSKLTDLGLARFTGNEGMGLTQTGFVVGTPYYIAPEQARGESEIDIRADLYSLGVTFYEMLAGKPPFTGSEPIVVLNKHLNETVRFAMTDVPADLLAIGHRMTERDRFRRYAAPAQVLEDLEAFEQGKALAHARPPVRSKTSRPTTIIAPRTRSPLPLVLAGAGAVALLAVLAVALSGTEKPVRPAATAPAPKPPPPPPAPSPPRDKPVHDAEGAALAALTRARQYELANSNDLEEIAALYADAEAKTANTSYAETARKRAEETRSGFLKAVEDRKETVLAEMKAGRKFGPALEILDRHARDYRTAEWKIWLSAQRAETGAALAARANSLREAAAAAGAKGDHEGALAALRTLGELGVPALTREASERIEKLEADRRIADADRVRALDAERARLEAFFTQADGWAAAREFEKIEPAAPPVAAGASKDLLKTQLAFYRAGQELLDGARKHLAALQGRNASFTTRNGESVTGRVGAVQDRPFGLLVGDRAYLLVEFSTRSLVTFYKGAKGSAARPECIVAFALFDGDAAVVEETLAKSRVELGARARKAWDELRRKAAEEARIRKEETAVAKKPESGPREVVVYATDLPATALGKDFEIWDDVTSPGSKMIGVKNDGDPLGPPPDPDSSATFKAQVAAGVPYRCWIRMKVGKAKKNSQANMLYVQFSHAVDKQGKEVFSLATGDYHVVRAPAREGWVWAGRDVAEPKSPEPVLYFKAAGEITIRISAGMEGVGFDQVVLSSGPYFTKPPSEAVVAKPKK